jgi:hypothetical protein
MPIYSVAVQTAFELITEAYEALTSSSPETTTP